jgi:cell division protein FtsI/penicillin-binding protein 2
MRGTIRDRFHVILAANAIEYRVGVVWPPIQEIPRKIIENGQKRFLRKDYVKALSKMIGKVVDIDPQRIEDTIYSYAVFSQTTAVVLKTGLTEQQYYRLTMAAKDWPGLVVERAPKRVYPRGRSGCHVIGYTAPLNRQEYDRAVSEIRFLREYVGGVERGEVKELPPMISSFFAAKERLMGLERRAYGLNDEIGKTGVEAAFEPQLRGLVGKKYFIANAFGERLREAAGSREAVPGKRLVVSISSELQEWCEKLLAQSDADRFNRLERDKERVAKGAKNPLVRGGAIVAIDPKTAEVVACASYPRFDPNDFVRSSLAVSAHSPQQKTARWLEGEVYVKKVWDLEWPMVREEADDTTYHEKNVWLTWEQFLSSVLPTEAFPLRLLPPHLSVLQLLQLQTKGASRCSLQATVGDDLFPSSPDTNGSFVEDASALVSTLNEDRRRDPGREGGSAEDLILVDLTRLLLRCEELSDALVETLGPYSIDTLRSLISAKVAFSDALRQELKERFQRGLFQEWREQHGTQFLSEKRKEERDTGIAPRPFLQYLEKECADQFSVWWKQHGDSALLSAFSPSGIPIEVWVQKGIRRCVSTFSNDGFHKERREELLLLSSLIKQLPSTEGLRLLAALKGYEALTHPLFGKYTSTVCGKAPATAQDLIRSFLALRSPPLASFCHMQPSAQGSMFKLVVAYAALHQQLQKLRGEERLLLPSFFRITDQTFHSGGRVYVGYDSSGKPIPQLYKGGRLPRSAEPHLGELDLIRAIGRSSNPYFALLAGDFLSSPQVLVDAAKNLGFGEKTGIALPSESAGRVPSDLETNKTGVYTTAIGQHTMMATPLQSAVMLSAFATCGDVVIPRLVRMAIGPEAAPLQQFRDSPSYAGRDLMRAIGFDVPVWLAQAADIYKHHIQVTTRRTKRHVDISQAERRLLFEGMCASIERTMNDHNLPKLFAHRPNLLTVLHGMRGQMIGKSSTAESYERLGLGIGQKPCMYNHTWFGGIFFPESSREARPFENQEAELVVVVFLRYGTFGKDAAPLAASVAHEWRQIQRRHGV